MLKIVIVDDETLARASIKSMLEELHLPIEVVGEGSNGEDLVELVRTLRPDLAFVDIKMPKLSGLEAIKIAKGLGTGCQWIVLTGFSEFEYAREALHLGASCFLLKPVSLEELEEKMKLVFEKMQIDLNKLSKPTTLMLDAQAEAEAGNALIKELKNYLEIHYMEEIGLTELADKLHITPNYLSRLFHKHTGCKFMKYLTDLRMAKAKDLLQNSSMSVQQVSEAVGYHSARHFTGLFKNHYGKYPSECRSGRISKTSKIKLV